MSKLNRVKSLERGLFRWLRALSVVTALGFTASGFNAAHAAPFTIDIRFLGQPLTLTQKNTIAEAAQRVSKLIASPFVPVTLDLPPNFCDPGLPRLKEKVQHFFIFLKVKDLGEDVYGNAVPCDLHDGSYLPIYSLIELNSRGLKDLPKADLLDTMIHEMLHALGVGTLWEADARVSLGGDSDNKSFVRKIGKNYFYTGPRALAAYRALGGKQKAIPLDPDAGHWAGSVVCSEILSGEAGDFAGRVNPISPLTLGALEDLGYRVNVGAANRYTLPTNGCPVEDSED